LHNHNGFEELKMQFVRNGRNVPNALDDESGLCLACFQQELDYLHEQLTEVCDTLNKSKNRGLRKAYRAARREIKSAEEDTDEDLDDADWAPFFVIRLLEATASALGDTSH
jgi:hypothetical protein